MQRPPPSKADIRPWTTAGGTATVGVVLATAPCFRAVGSKAPAPNPGKPAAPLLLLAVVASPYSTRMIQPPAAPGRAPTGPQGRAPAQVPSTWTRVRIPRMAPPRLEQSLGGHSMVRATQGETCSVASARTSPVDCWGEQSHLS